MGARARRIDDCIMILEDDIPIFLNSENERRLKSKVGEEKVYAGKHESGRLLPVKLQL
jgi:hypothetical protein